MISKLQTLNFHTASIVRIDENDMDDNNSRRNNNDSGTTASLKKRMTTSMRASMTGLSGSLKKRTSGPGTSNNVNANVQLSLGSARLCGIDEKDARL